MMHQTSFQGGGSPTDVNAGPRLRLGEALVEKGLLTVEQLEETLLHQSKRGHKKLLGEVLVELNFVSEEQVMVVLADSYHCSQYNVNTGRLTPAMFEAVFARLRELLGDPRS